MNGNKSSRARLGGGFIGITRAEYVKSLIQTPPGCASLVHASSGAELCTLADLRLVL
jgi:hypothetical protein